MTPKGGLAKWTHLSTVVKSPVVSPHLRVYRHEASKVVTSRGPVLPVMEFLNGFCRHNIVVALAVQKRNSLTP
jgi:hypothetical protein